MGDVKGETQDDLDCRRSIPQSSFPYLNVESLSAFLLINLLDSEPKKDQRFVCLNTGQLSYHIFKSSAWRLNLLPEYFLFGALQWTQSCSEQLLGSVTRCRSEHLSVNRLISFASVVYKIISIFEEFGQMKTVFISDLS